MSDKAQGEGVYSQRYHPIHFPIAIGILVLALCGLLYAVWTSVFLSSSYDRGGVLNATPAESFAYTLVFSYLYLRMGLYGITFVHRHVAHQAFETYGWVRAIFFALFYSTMEAPVRLWCAWHREHHAASDVPKDRHSPHIYGLWHAQETWHWKASFISPPPGKYFANLRNKYFSPIDKMDANYMWWAWGMSIALPTVVCGVLWGSWLGGVLIAGFLRLSLVQQLTSTINSVMHWWGERVEGAGYATNTRSRLFAWLVVGEPSHGNHHLVPNAYRMGWRRGDCDPGARMIEMLARIGLAWNLRTHTGEIQNKRTQGGGS